MISLALQVPDADVHCRHCLTTAVSQSRAPAVSLLSFHREMTAFWTLRTGRRPRALFVCVAAVCGFSAPSGHLLVTKNLDLVLEEPVESPSPDHPTVHAALLPQQVLR